MVKNWKECVRANITVVGQVHRPGCMVGARTRPKYSSNEYEYSTSARNLSWKFSSNEYSLCGFLSTSWSTSGYSLETLHTCVSIVNLKNEPARILVMFEQSP